MAYQMPKAEGVRHEFIKVNGSSIHVAISGERTQDNANSAVLLVHDWPQHWYAWRGVLTPLGEDRMVVAPDLRGFGWSEIAWENLDTTSHAKDLIAIVEKLDLEQVHIVGLGDGGWVASEFASIAPDRVASLTLVNADAPWDRKGVARNSEWRSRLLFTIPIVRTRICRTRKHHGVRKEVAASVGFIKVRFLRPRSYIERLINGRASGASEPSAAEQRRYAMDSRAWPRVRASVGYQSHLLTERLHAVVRRRHRAPDVLVHRIRSTDSTGHYIPEEDPETIVSHLREVAEIAEH